MAEAENIDIKWTPGKSVSPADPDLEQIGRVKEQFSGTIEKQKTCTTYMLYQDQKYPLEKQSTQVRSEKTEKNSSSSELPPDLMEDILSLRYDYLEEDRKEDYDGPQTMTGTAVDKSQMKAFSEPLAGFKTFGNNTENMNVSDTSVHVDVSIKRNCSNVDSSEDFEPKVNVCTIENQPAKLSAAKTSLEAEKPGLKETSSIQKFQEYFASQGKDFKAVKTGSDLSNAGSVSVLELKKAAKERGIHDEILFISGIAPSDVGTRKKPISIRSGMPAWQEIKMPETWTVLPSNANQETIFMSRNVPVPSCTQLSKPLLNPASQTFPRTENQFLQHSSTILTRSIPGCSSGSVLPPQDVTYPSCPATSSEPEPPDLTHYTCSEPLKQVLQNHIAGKQINRTDPQLRFHPYQKTLPNLPEFNDK